MEETISNYVLPNIHLYMVLASSVFVYLILQKISFKKFDKIEQHVQKLEGKRAGGPPGHFGVLTQLTGSLEAIALIALLVFQRELAAKAVGLWLVIKTAGSWESWKDAQLGRIRFNKFALGFLLNLLLIVLSVTLAKLILGKVVNEFIPDKYVVWEFLGVLVLVALFVWRFSWPAFKRDVNRPA